MRGVRLLLRPPPWQSACATSCWQPLTYPMATCETLMLAAFRLPSTSPLLLSLVSNASARPTFQQLACSGQSAPPRRGAHRKNRALGGMPLPCSKGCVTVQQQLLCYDVHAWKGGKGRVKLDCTMHALYVHAVCNGRAQATRHCDREAVPPLASVGVILSVPVVSGLRS